MKNSSLCLLSALGGAIVGAAIAVLITPQSGKELREKIRSSIDDAARRMRHHCDCEGEGCHCNDEE
ncbi:MAG: YtxH domain-containing protein [Alistipes sp.]|nr:YtxH domain-containing protein [Alistipes sp.]